MHFLRTKNKVIVPLFNTYFMKNSMAHRASIVWNLLTPDLAKTFNYRFNARSYFERALVLLNDNVVKYIIVIVCEKPVKLVLLEYKYREIFVLVLGVICNLLSAVK